MSKLSKYRSFILAFSLVLGSSSTEAVPMLPSSFAGNPPAIKVFAPVSGAYMLIEHSEETGDRLVTHAILEGGDIARFIMPILDGRTSYHVQVMADPFATHIMFQTIQYRGWVVGAPVVYRAPLSPVYLPMMGS